jgi:CubicO group peptidase (beta-lactamase class C family)
MLFNLYRLVCLLALSVSLSAMSGAQTTPRASWPTRDWPTATPESQGVASAQLAAAIEQIRPPRQNIHSLLIVRNGYLITEAYFFPYEGKEPHDLASVTKSLTATLIGMAIAQGKIKSVQEPLLAFFKGRKFANPDARKEKITIEHLLTMSSGLDCAGRGETALWGMLSAPDNVQYMLDLPVIAEPGSTYGYCSGGMHLLSAILTQATGMKAEDFALKYLFAPLGIQPVKWPADPQGINHGFGNLHLLPRDLAKLGLLFLNQGKWEDRQLVPAQWIKEATRSHLKTGGAGTSDYGYGWRIPPPGGLIGFEAGGRGGQQLSVLPSKNTVIVLNGGGYSTGEVMKLLLPALQSDQPLPENRDAVAKLRGVIAAAAKPPAPLETAKLPELAHQLSGQRFEFTDNWLGLRALTLTFRQTPGPALAKLEFVPALKQFQFGTSAKIRGLGVATELRPVGLYGVPLITGDGIMGSSVGLKGNWEAERTFVLEYDEIASTNSYRLRLSFSETGVEVQAKERTGLFDEKFAGIR